MDFTTRLFSPYTYYKARYMEAKQDRVRGDYAKNTKLVETCVADYKAAELRSRIWIAVAIVLGIAGLAALLLDAVRGLLGLAGAAALLACAAVGLLLMGSEMRRMRAINRLDRHHMRDAIAEIIRRER